LEDAAMPELKHTEGYRYLQKTKFTRSGLEGRERPHIEPVPAFKTYPAAKSISLPTDWAKPDADLLQVLQQRRSSRRYCGTPLTVHEISLLLWASQGVTGRAGNWLLRTAPSAGALYPIETYVVMDKASGLDAGLYHFNVADFALESLLQSRVAKDIAAACLMQHFMAEASALFAWSAVLRRNMAKYGHRGLRYICMDAGHICQNLLLAAEALGRKACPVAAFFDDELNRILGLDGEEETVLYLAAVG